MGEAADYRKRAEECVADTPAQRTMLLHIADTGLRLAKDAEENAMRGVTRTSRRTALM